MPDREKVIKGITECTNSNNPYCHGCPYDNNDEESTKCSLLLMKDALKLLNKYAKIIDKLEQVRLSENLRMYVDEILDELYNND